MPCNVVIIGAGMGGLTAAIRLAHRGCRVTVLEARGQPGGLAANVVFDGFPFDAGPYVLLDRPGLEWAFRQLEMELTEKIQLNRIPDVYMIDAEHGPSVSVFDSLDRTADEIDRCWPGSGDRYRTFIERMQSAYPARLIAPMQYHRAEQGGEAAQLVFLNNVLEETWWRQQFDNVRILATRIPLDWGSTFHLFRSSMNPVMTARFMRAGRLAHRSPWIRGLYLTGSATHPGQWVSFCAVSGVLAANQLLKDLES
jgi:phytoene dehydrogenase-like protein